MQGGSGVLAQGPAETVQAPAAASPWRDLRVRTASAVILAPLCLAALWWGGLAWNGLIVLLAVGMAYEWLGMGRASGWRTGLPAMLAIGICYVLPATIALIWLRDADAVGRANVLFVVLIVWSSDIGAYLLGRLLGGPKLAPVISPGKTWTGALGGLIAAGLVGVVAAMLWQAAWWPAALVAGLLGLVSQAGDLVESAAKRYFGVKDSGRLIPGHGGLLDRLDGLLAAAPMAALLVWGFGQGRVLWQ